MRAERKSLSIKTITFFLNLRRILQASNCEVEDLFTKHIFLKNSKVITQVQLVKIIDFSYFNFGTMDKYQIYNELKNGPELLVKDFILSYNQIVSKFPPGPNNELLKNNKNKSMNTKQLQNKILKNAYLKLHKFLREKSGLQLFEQSDETGAGYLTAKQFNKLLISTDIKQFSSKDIRRTVVKQIFSYFPNNKMSKFDFAKMFKIDVEAYKKKKEAEQIPKIKIIQSKDKPMLSKEKQKEQKKEQLKQIETKKLQIPHKQDPKVPVQPQKPKNNSKEQQQQINARQIFPQAYRYYRLGIPPQQQLQYFEALQNMLISKKIFKDKNNPITHLGQYKYANEFFQSNNYEIFIMAASVIQRQKSRIGIAREIEPKDIMQGQLGDCYFLSSIASIISFYPESIVDKILFSVNYAHFYVVKLFIDGQWQMIITDDQFPCQYGKPVFAKPHGRQIWVMLLQKCWAKVYGSYQAIESGTPTQGFQALTGAPCEYALAETPQDLKKIQAQLEEAFEKRYVVTISGSKYLSNLSQQQQDELGLISNHAYSFLKLLKINGELIVKMRNPWGKTIWKGDWSFESKKWTKQLRDKYNYNYKPDDGSFYIAWSTMIKYFNSFVICKIDPTYLHTSYRLRNTPHKSNYLKMEVSEAGTYNLSVYFESKRKNKSPNYQYSPVRLILVKYTDGKIQYINSANKSKTQCATFQSDLGKGTYLIAIKVEWENQQPKEIVFNTYGVETVKISQINRQIAPKFKQGLILSYSKKFKGKIKPYTKINLPEAYNEIQISIDRGIGYLRVKNPTNTKFESTLSMPQVQGLKMIKPNKLPITFYMDPNTEVVVGFWVSSKGYSYQSSESITY